jgi:ribonuclease Z
VLGGTTMSMALLRAIRSRAITAVLAVGLLAAGSATAATHVILLGTGNPNAEPERSGPAFALAVGDHAYLVDAGPGVVRRAAAAASQYGLTGLQPENLGRVFLTHLHSDHTTGLADLILAPWVLGRTAPLEVFGPPGTARMTRHLLAAYREDIRLRLDGLEPANPTGWKVVTRTVRPGEVFRDDRVTVEAFRVPHGEWRESFGYRFTTADGTVVFSGDSGPFDGLAEIARGAEVLLHEAYATAGFARREPAWQRYHAAYHSSGVKVGEIAAAAGAHTVVLIHQLLWGAGEADLVSEVRSAFAGDVVYGRDLDVLEVCAGGPAVLLPRAR